MEVYGILSLFDNMFNLSKNDNDRLLILQHKFVYLMCKKDFLNSITVKNKLYQQAIDILNNGNYHNIHHVVQPFVEFCQNQNQQSEIEIIDFT